MKFLENQLFCYSIIQLFNNMVAKISSSNNLYGTLIYNQTKVDKDKAKVIYAANMKDPENGIYNMNVCLKSFESRLKSNQRTEKPVLHLSLNPDPKDNLTDEQLSEIAQTYMQKMGYGDQPFIVYKHEDIERQHIHIVSMRVDAEGKKINDKFEHRRSMDVCRELEQKYGLVAADKKQRQDVLPLKKVDYEKGDVKHQLANVIRPISKEWYFQSFNEYKTLLSLYNIGVEEVKTPVMAGLTRHPLNQEIAGLRSASPAMTSLSEKSYEVTGLTYSALNAKGERVGSPLKSSLFGKEAGLEALNKRYVKSKEAIKDRGMKERSKKVISEALLICKSRPELEKALEKQNISAIFRENEQGRIYGATFIDHEQKCIFNGSSLGKEFSANVFNDLFNGREINVNPYEKKEFEPFQKHEREENSNLGGFFDLFNIETSIADEIEEQKLTRLMKKKSKQQRRM